MLVLARLLALLALSIIGVRIQSDAGAGIDPNGGRRVTTAACTGDYSACVDPNG